MANGGSASLETAGNGWCCALECRAGAAQGTTPTSLVSGGCVLTGLMSV